MKDIELLLPRVLQYCAAAPEPLVVRNIRDAAIEFCRRTRVWRSRQTFNVLASSPCEIVVPDQHAAVFEIREAVFHDGDDNNTPLKPVAIDWMDTHQPGWRDWEGNPTYVTQAAPDTILLIGPADGSVTLDLVLEPAADAQFLTDVLIDKYGRDIAGGATGETLLTPGDFQDAALGAAFAERFQDVLDHQTNLIGKGQQGAPRRATARWL